MKRAFTLIELIATIVILGVVTSVVSILIMNVIKNVKDSARKRSIDNYGRIIETSMAEYQSQYLKYPDSIDQLEIEYVGSVIECEIRRINPDKTIYLSECKVNGKKVLDKSTEDGYYHYGTLVLTNEEYVDKLGKNIEVALKDYYEENNKYPVNYRLLNLPKLDKDVNCVSDINLNGTVYLTKCSIDGGYVLDDSTEDGYYQYGESLTAVKYLLKKTNPITVTNYTDGDIHEMYTFEHEATEQTPALTDYRYIGSDPNNYVSFNNGEVWRIIGVFDTDDGTGKYEKRIKLIRNESLGNMQWNSSTKNEWLGSPMQVYLNDTYTLNDKSSEMIAASKWYLGGRAGSGNCEAFYASERSETVNNADRSKNWTGLVGLMYPSDYIYTYALGVDDTCYNTSRSCDNGTPSSGWIYKSASIQWTMTPRSSDTFCVFNVRSSGYVDCYGTNQSYETRPVVYLKPNVKIKSGDGSIDSPYEFEL